MTTRVMIADDQPLIRDGLAAVLQMESGYEVVARTGDGLSTVQQALLHRPDLILLDIHMPELDGLQAAEQIKAACPDTKILMLTTFEDDEYIWKSIRCGASGYLVKGSETEFILRTITDCLAGRINFPHSIQDRLMEIAASREAAGTASVERDAGAAGLGEQKLLDGLTQQERNIVAQLKLGKSNGAIAAELFLTTGTVKNYLNAIYKKLGVSSRSEAIAILHRLDM